VSLYSTLHRELECVFQWYASKMQSGIECCHMKSAGLLIGEICFHAEQVSKSRFSVVRLVLPFWYWLTWVVPEKGPLNMCVYVCLLLDRIAIQSI